MDGEQLEILKELCASVVPLGVLTVIVLAVILFGICTATESAAIGALGALYLAVMARYLRPVLWWSLVGLIVGVLLGWYEGEDFASLIVAGSISGTLLGTVAPGLWYLRTSPELRRNVKESTFLTAKPMAMSAFYLKGVSPKHVTLNQIFAGMMPYMIIVCICLAFMYIWPGMTLWLPEFLYGK